MDKKTSSDNLKVVIVNGRPGSGKTTFEKMCMEKMGQYCRITSTIDCIKMIAAMGGWNGKKEPKDRKFLSDLKDLFTEYNNYPFNYVKDQIMDFEAELKTYDVIDHPHVVFVDCREPREIEKFKNYYGKNTITLIIWRSATDFNETSNHADEDVWKYKYDCIIENNGSLEELSAKAEGFLDLIFS